MRFGDISLSDMLIIIHHDPRIEEIYKRLLSTKLLPVVEVKVIRFNQLRQTCSSKHIRGHLPSEIVQMLEGSYRIEPSTWRNSLKDASTFLEGFLFLSEAIDFAELTNDIFCD